MFHILPPNPEAYRDWQYSEYQRCLCEDQDEEPTLCKVCGNNIHDEFISVSGDHHVCDECIRDEMAENECSIHEAIESLTIQCNTIHKSFALPTPWKEYLLDVEDKTQVIPEASKFLNQKCPRGYYLDNITAYGIEGDIESMRYHFSWRKMRVN